MIYAFLILAFVLIEAVLFIKYNTGIYLRSVFTVSIFVGYSLSLLLSLLDGYYEKFMLIQYNIHTVVFHAFISLILFYVGWKIVNFKSQVIKDKGLDELVRKVSTLRVDKTILYYVLFILCMFIIINLIFILGKIEYIWDSPYGKNQGRYISIIKSASLQKFLTVMYSVSVMVTIAISSVTFHKRKEWMIPVIIPVTTLCIGSILFIHNLSRGAGFPLFMLAVTGLMIKGKQYWFKSMVMGLLAVYMGLVGLYARGHSTTGLKNYSVAFVEYFNTSLSNDDDSLRAPLYSLNPLDQIPPFTQVVLIRKYEKPSMLSALKGVIMQLNPLPTGMIGYHNIGISSLREHLGVGNGITVPTMAQLYHPFGHYACLYWGLFGCYCGIIDRKIRTKPSIILYLAFLFTIYGMFIGLHSHFRSFIRPVGLGFILIVLDYFINSLNFRNRPDYF
ncbi:hypothetical protein P3T73_02165 [Kiritimatiellota bacterium B12222]|nr:hypothetical protein P3T73_02165 [Kiritimatiellota bacterium B12222]